MDFLDRAWYNLIGADGVRMVRKTDISEAAAGAEPGMEAPVPARRAVLKAAASVPVILTILGGPARAGYENGGR